MYDSSSRFVTKSASLAFKSRSFIFSSVVFPVKFSGISVKFWGLISIFSSMGSMSKSLTETFFSPIFFVKFSYLNCEFFFEQMPNIECSSILFASSSITLSPIWSFTTVMSLWLTSRSACTWYRPSTNRYTLSFVTRASPVEPENPVRWYLEFFDNSLYSTKNSLVEFTNK